jgi:RNA polymerase sigma factor (TIGR02999 family)
VSAASIPLVKLFRDWRKGDREAGNLLYTCTAVRLRLIARALLSRERPNHTLQPTALVSELFLRFRRGSWNAASDDHFFRLSARTMRQVLIDYSRRRAASKRVAFGSAKELPGAPPRDELALDVRRIFTRLHRLDPRVAETLWLRCVEGATLEEIACRQRVEIWRVRENYDYGVKWMADHL